MNRVETGKQLPSLEFAVKAAAALEVGVDQLLGEDAHGLEDVRLDDTGMAQRLRLLESLDEHEREALKTVIDSMLTKHRIRDFLEQEQRKAS